MTAKTTLNVGMVGAGFVGQIAHLMNLIEVDRCRVVALAELRPELRRRVAARYSIPRTYATHEELLADPEVDAVIVVTPRPFTFRVVRDCLEAGKHVLSEKPMAGTAAQAEILVELARKRGVHYVVGYMKRHDEGVQKAKQILDDLILSRELGSIVFARAHCYMGDSYCRADGHVTTEERAESPFPGEATAPEDFPEKTARDYAFYLNTYSHNTNLLRYLFDRTPQVVAVHFGVASGRVATLDFGSFVATLETGRSTCRGWDEITEVWFDDGRLTLRTPPALLKNVPAQVELYRAGSIQRTESPQIDWTWAFRRQARAFVEDVLEGRPPLSPGSDALEDLRLIEAMWRSEMVRLDRAGRTAPR